MATEYCPFQYGKACGSDCPLYTTIYDDHTTYSGCALYLIAQFLFQLQRK